MAGGGAIGAAGTATGLSGSRGAASAHPRDRRRGNRIEERGAASRGAVPIRRTESAAGPRTGTVEGADRQELNRALFRFSLPAPRGFEPVCARLRGGRFSPVTAARAGKVQSAATLQ